MGIVTSRSRFFTRTGSSMDLGFCANVLSRAVGIEEVSVRWNPFPVVDIYGFGSTPGDSLGRLCSEISMYVLANVKKL